MAGKLTNPLKRLFRDLDQRWPHRDHRTDGWYADPKVRKSKGHNPGHKGFSHAIDVDKDGIDPMWIIRNITKNDRVLWYIIWNRKLYSNTYNWVPRDYHGKNPHTDHMHIETYQTDYAETWGGSWGIGDDADGQPPHTPPPSTGGDGGGYVGDFGADYGGRDYRGYFTSMGDRYASGNSTLAGYAGQLRTLRR